MAINYFPALSTIISEDQIPESLNFIVGGLTALLDNIHFKDLLTERSFDNATIACKLTSSVFRLLRLVSRQLSQRTSMYVSCQNLHRNTRGQ